MVVWIALPMLAAVVCGTWIYWANHTTALASRFTGADGLESAAMWGDSFGGFNALFGALGFSAVLATLLFQAVSLSRQQKDLHRQAFESSFFEILRLVRQSRDEVRYKTSIDYRKSNPKRQNWTNDTNSGLLAFRAAATEILYWRNKDIGKPSLVSAEALGRLYSSRIHRRYESTLGTYFRLIYAALARIDGDEVLTAKQKVQYANLLRGQLNTYETVLIAYNALSPVSGDMKRLVEKYRMLKYLRSGTTKTMFKRVYDEQAFEARGD